MTTDPSIALLAGILQAHGWSCTPRARFGDWTFDLAAESDSVVVFAMLTSAATFTETAAEATAEIAAVMAQHPTADKSWEAYLLLLSSGAAFEVERDAQRLQHNLDYCRKVLIDATRIMASPDPVSAAEEAVAFLFPVKITETVAPIDVSAELVAELTREGLDPDMVRALVTSFDEPDCRCVERVIAGIPPSVDDVDAH